MEQKFCCRDSVPLCMELGLDCVNVAENEVQLHGLKLLNALMTIEPLTDENCLNKNYFERFSNFLSSTIAAQTTPSISVESLELYGKLFEKVD